MWSALWSCHEVCCTAAVAVGVGVHAALGVLCCAQVMLRNVGLLAARKLKAAVSSPLVALGVAAPAGAAAAAGDSTDVWTSLQGEGDWAACWQPLQLSLVEASARGQWSTAGLLVPTADRDSTAHRS
jgi:hypothetical protein